jgi:CRISPR-associated protein Cmr4
MSNPAYKNKTYFAMSLDPIHIGTGGYRLGRVDNTIVRESGTNIPKIPGTSIEGSARLYATYKEAEKDHKHLNCADKEKHKEKCPKQNYRCPICVTFGYTDSKVVPEGKPKSLHGMAQFSDARILFFPVHSIIGPVWITCPSVLREIYSGEFKEPLKKESIVVSKQIKKNHDLEKLNLGWLYLDLNKENNDFISIPEFKGFKDILEKIVVVHNDIFEKIVNSNLEVRTSVSIDPRTGAAEDRALFTYEAIPRATIFWFNVIFNNPKYFNAKIKLNSELKKPELNEHIISTAESGIKLFEFLGIGGMQTRGFGRLRILNGDSDGSK